MATYTAPSQVTAGVSSLTAANFNTYIRDNVEFLRDKDTSKADSDLAFASLSGSEHDFNWDVDTIDWNEGSQISLSSDWMFLGSGLWFVGCTGKWAANAAGDRRLRLYEALSGTSGTLLADNRAQAPATPARLTSSTVYDFNSTDRDFRPRHFQDSGTGVNVDGTFWSLQLGGDPAGTDLGTSNPFTSAEITAPSGVVAWWNDVAYDCIRRLYYRPAARVYRSTNQTINNASWTQVTFNVESYDTAGMVVGGDETELIAPYDGVYYIHGGYRFDSFTTAGARTICRVNAEGVYPFSDGTQEASSNDSSGTVEGLWYLNAGDAVSLEVYQDRGSSASLQGSETVHLGMVAMSVDADVTNREYFVDGAPTGNYSWAAPDSTTPTSSLALLMGRDVLCDLWNPPAVGSVSETNEIELGNGVWDDLPCGIADFSSWPDTVLPEASYVNSNGLVLPRDGVYLVTAYVAMTAGVDNDEGDEGNRGLKIRHGNRHESPVRVASQTSPGDYWWKTTSCLVNARAGDEVWPQGLQKIASGDNLDVELARVAAVWVRPRI